MEWNRRPRNKPTQIQPSDLKKKSQKHTLERRQPLQKLVLEKMDIHM
jgi:hypothetical protein